MIIFTRRKTLKYKIENKALGTVRDVVRRGKEENEDENGSCDRGGSAEVVWIRSFTGSNIAGTL